MPDEDKGVEKEVVKAPDNQEEVKESVASPDDPEVKIAKLEEALAKTTRDRDNYRNATLTLKGKEVENFDPNDPEQLDALITKKVRDTLAESESERALQSLVAEAKASAKREKELRRALSSKAASTSIAGGGGAGSGEIAGSEKQTSYFSQEQVAELKARGLSDAQIKQVELLDRTGAPGAAKTR